MAKLYIGKHSYGQEHFQVRWANPGSNLVVGAFCSIANDIKIYLGGNHRTDWVTTYPFGHRETEIFKSFDGTGIPSTRGDIIIGNDVWIGAYTTIMSGVNIGDGAVVACNSHVVKDIPPYAIVGGNPAKLIRYRFSPKQIKSLLDIKWWNWDDEKIDKYSPLLCSSDIDKFIETVTV